jgi:hypothetical protein
LKIFSIFLQSVLWNRCIISIDAYMTIVNLSCGTGVSSVLMHTWPLPNLQIIESLAIILRSSTEPGCCIIDITGLCSSLIVETMFGVCIYHLRVDRRGWYLQSSWIHCKAGLLSISVMLYFQNELWFYISLFFYICFLLLRLNMVILITVE